MMQLETKMQLEKTCANFRLDLIEVLHDIQTGHPGGSLSAAEIITTVYLEKMNGVDPKNPDAPDRDRFVLSKGHAAPMFYLAMAEKGMIEKKEIKTLRQMGSRLQGHPSVTKLPGIDLSTGPLGLGLSAGIGMGLSAKVKGNDYYTYVLLGDGEIQEGIIWEAAMSASKFKVDNVITFLDLNGVQLDGTTEEILPMGDIEAKWKSFGFNTITIDGHDVKQISDAVDMAKEKKGVPTIIIAYTIKGKGVSFMEGKNIWHGKPISDDEYKQAMTELGGNKND